MSLAIGNVLGAAGDQELFGYDLEDYDRLFATKLERLLERFAPFAELHRRATQQGGHAYQPLSINSHGFIAETREEAVRVSFPAFTAMMDRIGRERGWPPLTREQYLASHELRGANFVGSPDQIVEKILFQHEIFKHDRFLLQMSVGTLPHADVMRAIELLGTEVAPKVREALPATQAANR